MNLSDLAIWVCYCGVTKYIVSPENHNPCIWDSGIIYVLSLSPNPHPPRSTKPETLPGTSWPFDDISPTHCAFPSPNLHVCVIDFVSQITGLDVSLFALSVESYHSLEKNTRGQPDGFVSLAKWRILNRLHDRNETLYYRVSWVEICHLVMQ